jgi:thymidine kinase
MNNNNNNNTMATGYLGLFLGCMYSGKTSRLISLYNKYKKAGQEVCVINYISDVRYHTELMSSHDKVMIPCLKAKNIYDIFRDPKLLKKVDVYLINEGQFFPDLFEMVKILVSQHKKKVYVGGLDGDFERKEFGQLLKLIPFANSYEKLYAKCNKCGAKASFTKRLTNEKEQTIIGGTEMYIPVCRECYN